MKQDRPAEDTFQRTLESRVELLEPLVDETEAFLLEHTDDDELVYRAVLLVSEAATNAMKHGNRFDPNKRVRLEVVAEGAGVRIRVCDEGEGFDPGTIDDPLAQDHLLNTGGRGLFLIREMADEVSFGDRGRCVIMTIRR